MDRKNIQRIEMLGRVVEFGAAHTDLFPKNTLGGQSFAALGAALSTLSEHASEQVTRRNAIRANSTVRSSAREALRGQIARITQTGNAMAIDAPELRAKFRLPLDHDQDLLLAGRALASETEPLKKEFVRHGMPVNFIQSLIAAVDAFERSIRDQSTSKTKRANNTHSVESTLDECMTTLKVLDAVIGNIVAGDSPVKAEWDTARRVRRVAQRSATAKSSPESGSASAA